MSKTTSKEGKNESFIVSKLSSEEKYSETVDFRLALLGNVDSGKSTLCGVLSRGLLDNGRGSARSFVLRHQHEHERGQTSSVSVVLLGFSKEQQVIPKSVQSSQLKTKNHIKDCHDIASIADHRCILVDLCGHEKYLKTTIFGLTGMTPNAAMIVVGANNGIQRMTREHIGLCCALNIPFFVVVTKIDMCPEKVYLETIQKVKRVLNRAGRKAYSVSNQNNIIKNAVNILQTNTGLCPLFEVSSVSGEGVDSLRNFIRGVTIASNNLTDIKLKSTSMNSLTEVDENDENFVQFFVDDVFQVPGVGVVIGGILQTGEKIQVNDQLNLGPNANGKFITVSVKSIHRQGISSVHVLVGQHATLAIKSVPTGNRGSSIKLRKDMISKGMVAIELKDDIRIKDKYGMSISSSHTVYEFEAQVKVLHHSTTINPGYSPVVHIGLIRQATLILSIKDRKGNDVVARTGSDVLVRFRFLHSPEYLTVGRMLVFREGRAKGCGVIQKILPNNVS